MSRLGNLLSRVGGLFVQAKQPAGQTRELGITPRDPNWDRVVVIPRDNKQLTEPFRQNTWVHGCVGAISSRVGLTPFTLRTGKKDKEKVIEDGDLYRVFNRPNPNWSTFQLFESASMHLELGGNAIFVLDRNSFTEVPLEIWVFGRWRFEPQFVKGSRTVEWWKFRTSGSTWIRLEPYQVVHVGLVSPTGDHFGMAPMEAAMYAAKTDWLATGFNEKLLENGFSPGAVISWPEQGPNDLAGFKAKFLREHTSTPGSMDRAFRLALLTGGGTYQPMEYSARDAAYIEGRKMGRDEICVIFRVPVCVLGIGEKAGIIASGTPEAQSLKRFWGGTIKPRQQLIEDAWRAQFFWPFDDERTWPKFDTSEIEELQEERTAKVERVRILCGLGVPFNTANEKEGLGYDPIDGLDTGFLPMGMTPVEDVIDPPEKPAPIIMPPAAPTPLDPDAPEEPTPPKKPKPEDDEEEDPEEEKKSAPATSSAYVGTCPHCGEIELGSVPARPWHARAIRPHTDQHMVFCEEWEARVSPLERDFSSKLRNYLLKCRSFLNVKVDDALEASLKVGSLPPDFFDLSMSFDEMLRKISKQYFRKVAVEVGPLIESHINGAGVPFVFDPDNPALVKFLETKTIKVVSHVNQEAIREGVRDKLLESQKSNGTMEELRESLLDVIGDNRRRALTIARTETGQASNGLEHECNVEAGVKSQQWIATLDSRARDSHLEQMALGDWPINKPFPNGLMYPGDVNGPPEETINCFPGNVLVSGAFVAGSKAWYSGAICEIVTRSGKRLSVTPNHPVLTDQGWRKAGSLREGDYLLSENGDAHLHGSLAVSLVNDEQGPAAIKDVYDSMARHGSALAGAGDFHGDGEFCQGEIEVVDIDGMLMGDDNAERFERGLDLELEMANASTSAIGSRDSRSLRLGYSTQLCGNDPASVLPPSTATVEAFPPQAICIGEAATVCAVADESAKSGGVADPILLAGLLDAHPGFVVPDKIINVHLDRISAHVYDLQSSQGWIVAQGIVCGNCRCRVLAIE